MAGKADSDDNDDEKDREVDGKEEDDKESLFS